MKEQEPTNEVITRVETIQNCVEYCIKFRSYLEQTGEMPPYIERDLQDGEIMRIESPDEQYLQMFMAIGASCITMLVNDGHSDRLEGFKGWK